MTPVQRTGYRVSDMNSEDDFYTEDLDEAQRIFAEWAEGDEFGSIRLFGLYDVGDTTEEWLLDTTTDQLAHRRNPAFCAKCGGECYYDDDGNLKELDNGL